jgi:hypothetical protein
VNISFVLFIFGQEAVFNAASASLSLKGSRHYSGRDNSLSGVQGEWIIKDSLLFILQTGYLMNRINKNIWLGRNRDDIIFYLVLTLILVILIVSKIYLL